MLHLIYILRGSISMLRQGCSLSMLHRTCKKLHGALGWLNGMGVLGWFNGVGELVWVF